MIARKKKTSNLTRPVLSKLDAVKPRRAAKSIIGN